MTVEQMRIMVSKAPKYTSNIKAEITWSDKVAKMPDKQVMAIYYNLLNKGELVKK